MVRHIFIAGTYAMLSLLIAASTLSLGFAQVMSSSNYQILSDSVNTGGGLATSDSYQLETTLGEAGTGPSDSAQFGTRAGFLQMQNVYIAMTVPGSVAMSPSIPGVTGGTSTGQTDVRVTTDSFGGYELQISAVSEPAMQSGPNSIADYQPAGAVPDFQFTTGAADAHLAYSPEGPDVSDRFLDSGGVCGSGSDTVNRCWDGLATTTTVIASANSANHPDGASTTIKFQVGVGSSVFQAPGTYVATTTLTAMAS